MVDTSGFVVSAVLNVAIALIILSLFCYFRTRYSWIYNPRIYKNLRESRGDYTATQPPNPGKGWFSWFQVTYSTSDQIVAETAGVDALIYIKFFEICTKMFAIMAIPGIGILLPVNFTGNNGVDGFDSLTLSNIQKESYLMLIHAFTAYFCTFVACYYMFQLWNLYLIYRQTWLKQQALQNKRLTLLVHNVPNNIRSDKSLFEKFSSWFKNHTVNAYMARDTKKLRKLIEKRDKAIKNLEKANVTLQINTEKQQAGEKIEDVRPKVATKALCFGKVDAIQHYEEEIRKLNAEIASEQSHELGILKSGFVTFDSTVTVSSAKHLEKTNELYAYESKLAPEPRDVYWPSLDLNHNERMVKGAIVSGLLFLLIFFWTIPVTFVQSITTVSALAEVVPFLDGILNANSVVKGIIEGFLPGLALLLFNILLPTILLSMARFSGIEAISWQQIWVFRGFFLFQFFNNFLGTVIAGSIFTQIQSLTSSPANIVPTLGIAIPAVSTFFVTYVLLTALSVFPMLLLNPGGLIMGIIKKKYLVKTQADLEAVEQPSDMNYGQSYPVFLFIFIIGSSYCVVAPLVLLFCTLFFAIGYIISKYKVLYVTVPEYESGGSFWPHIFNKLIVGLLLGQCVIIAIFGIKEQIAAAVIALPLPFLTLLFQSMIHKAFDCKIEVLPVEIAVQVDQELEKAGIRGIAQRETLFNKDNITGNNSMINQQHRRSIRIHEDDKISDLHVTESSVSKKEENSGNINSDEAKSIEIPISSDLTKGNTDHEATNIHPTTKSQYGAISSDILSASSKSIPTPEIFVQQELVAADNIDPTIIGVQ